MTSTLQFSCNLFDYIAFAFLAGELLSAPALRNEKLQAEYKFFSSPATERFPNHGDWTGTDSFWSDTTYRRKSAPVAGRSRQFVFL